MHVSKVLATIIKRRRWKQFQMQYSNHKQ